MLEVIVAGLVVCRRRPHCTSAARAAVCSSVQRERSIFPLRAWHLELEVCIVWYRIESSKCGSSEQGVVTAAERDDIED